jgi:hypothetical protein
LSDLDAFSTVFHRRERGTRGYQRPTSIQARRSPGSASERLVGFDKEKMIGRSVFFAISRTIDSEKMPLTVDKPIKTVALTLAITSAKPT